MYGQPAGSMNPRANEMFNQQQMAGLQLAGGLQQAMQQPGQKPGAAMGQAMLDPRMMQLMMQMRGGGGGGMPGQPMGPGGLLGGGV